MFGPPLYQEHDNEREIKYATTKATILVFAGAARRKGPRLATYTFNPVVPHPTYAHVGTSEGLEFGLIPDGLEMCKARMISTMFAK